MKLNPPASSSDIEAAREIARRLHQRRRRADFEKRDARGGDVGISSPSRPAASAPARTPPAPAWRATRTTPPSSMPDEPEPPSWDDSGPAASGGDPLSGALGDLTGDAAGSESETPATAEAAGSGAALSFDEDEGTEHESEPVAAPPAPEDLPVDVEDVADAGVSPDEMVGAAAAAGGPEDDSFDEPLSGFGGPAAPEGDESAALGSTEDLFDEPPPPPSWDDVVEACRDVAGASGAMIIDPAGQVFAARGEWPDPGPDAIAGRLVAMMERTLKDAPTRSVSAPVGGQHLTAWRVPLAEGLVTAAFIADNPLRSDVRAAIDTEIRRGAGA